MLLIISDVKGKGGKEHTVTVFLCTAYFPQQPAMLSASLKAAQSRLSFLLVLANIQLLAAAHTLTAQP